MNFPDKIEIVFKKSDFRGKFTDPFSCPIAIAINMKFKNRITAMVGTENVRFYSSIYPCASYTIENGFNNEDYQYVKKHITKNPKKYQWTVTLIKVW